MIRYEFPLNERIRSLLRLEDLYTRFAHFAALDDTIAHHSALATLFELIDIGARADLKSDLLQELERQRLVLEALRNNPHISENALDQILNKIESSSARLLEETGKFGQHIRDSEWLMGIKQRMSIPGGACEFDLPAYHYWLHRPAKQRRNELSQWMRPLMPINNALTIILQLLRDSGKSLDFVAKHGQFQQMSGGKVVQMLQVSIASEIEGVPELSANKYAINVRFISPSSLGKPKTLEQDVPFELTYCNL